MADLTVQVAALNLSAGHDPSESSESAAPSITILSPPHDATTIDKNGDLYLVVGDEKRAFQVDSRALVRVSSMWNAMLTGNWAESRPASGSWIVALPSDSPRAIEILLHIIHHNTRQIPCAGDIEVDDLFHVAVAVDMYDLSGCLGLWAKSWSSAVAPVVQATSINVDVLTRLSWIAWVFGDQSLFQCVLSRLVMEVGSDEYGELVDAGRWELRDLDFVEAMFVLDLLAATRMNYIESLLLVLESAIQSVVSTPKTANPSSFCRSTILTTPRSDSARYKARADCTNAILGSLFQSLAAENLFPYPGGPENIFESVNMLKQRLVRVVWRIETLGVPGGGDKASMGAEAHAACNPKERLIKLLHEALGDQKCDLADYHREHFKKTAERIGVGESVRRT